MNVSSFFKQSEAGFTLTEMLVVVAIVALLSSVVIANIRTGDRGIQVRSSSQLVMATLREAQNSALGSKRMGVYFVLSEDPILFIDEDRDQLYDSGEEIRTIILGTNVFISSLTPGSPLHVFFSPPNPDVYINGSPIGADALVKIESQDDSAVARTLRINTLGLITIE